MAKAELLLHFWDHLEELRRVLIRILIAIGLTFLVVLCFYKTLFHFLVLPFEASHRIALTEQNLHRKRLVNNSAFPLDYSLPPTASIISKGEVEQLSISTYRLLPGQTLEYDIFIENSFNKLVIYSPLEGMVLAFKICFWASLALTSPFWIYQLLQFILPGLEAHEKKVVLPLLIGSLLFAGVGAAVAYYVTIPLANQYLTHFNTGLGQNLWSLSSYINYTFILILGHVIAFELCLALLFLVHFAILPVQWLISQRKVAILGALILGALLTPPDILTQLILACFLIALYELTILYGKLCRSRKA